MKKERELELEKIIKETPLALLALKENKEEIEFANSFLPYSIGIEIECNYKEGVFKADAFREIPYILSVNVDSSEQRYRIPTGIKGLVCLYLISTQLVKYSELNPLSGIHYHVDLGSDYNAIVGNEYEHDTHELQYGWVLKELDTWNYIGRYNTRAFSTAACWVRFQSGFKTMEFRIGEMTFDYKLLLKRILHLTEIVSTIKASVNSKPIVNLDIPDSKEIVKFVKKWGLRTVNGVNLHELSTLEEELKLLNTKPPEIIPVAEEEKSKIIKQRVFTV